MPGILIRETASATQTSVTKTVPTSSRDDQMPSRLTALSSAPPASQPSWSPPGSLVNLGFQRSPCDVFHILRVRCGSPRLNTDLSLIPSQGACRLDAPSRPATSRPADREILIPSRPSKIGVCPASIEGQAPTAAGLSQAKAAQMSFHGHPSPALCTVHLLSPAL